MSTATNPQHGVAGRGEPPTVLLTCAGRRTSLLKGFLVAAHARGGRALAADNGALAPTLYLADEGLQLPRVLEAGYIDALLGLVRRQRVTLLVPTIDTELAVLAENADRLKDAGCVALISSRMIEVTSDKWLTATECERAGIRAPRSWLPEQIEKADLPERLFLKPRDGSASQHAHPVHRGDLDRVLPLVPNPILQERLEGQEITIDALLDLDGRPIHCVPRKRIRTLGGESIEGVTMDDGELRGWIVRVLAFASLLGGRGPIALQAFLTADGPVLTEINARFGGGFPLTQAAGGHYPEWILRSLEGKALEPCFGQYTAGLYMTRYYVEHFTQEPLWS